MPSAMPFGNMPENKMKIFLTSFLALFVLSCSPVKTKSLPEAQYVNDSNHPQFLIQRVDPGHKAAVSNMDSVTVLHNQHDVEQYLTGLAWQFRRMRIKARIDSLNAQLKAIDKRMGKK